MEVNQDTIFDFTKKLIELGNIYEVQEDCTIKNTVTGQLIAIPSGKRSVPLKVFKEGMETGDYVFLMPYREPLGVNREREWFFDSLQAILGNLIKELMHKIIADAIAKKDDNYQNYAAISAVINQVDTTMLTELDKLRAPDLLFVNYNKKTKTACALSRILDPDLRSEHSKFRKKSWEVFEILYKEFIGTCTPEECYTYTSTILSIPETDAKLHVIVALAKAIGPFCRDSLDLDLHENELEMHLANLEGYAKLHAWVSATTPTVREEPCRPWNNTIFNSTPAASFGTSAPVPVTALHTVAMPGGVVNMGMGTPAFTPLVPASSLPPPQPTGPFGSGMGFGGGGMFR